VLILAVLLDSVEGIIIELGNTLSGKILIDVTNRRDAIQIDGTSNAEIIQMRLPSTYVVKAFNTAPAARQAEPVIDGIAIDGFVAGDSQAAKQRVLELVESLGFRPLDAGPLVMARALEALAILNISLNVQNQWPWQTGWRLLAPGDVPKPEPVPEPEPPARRSRRASAP
jgi:predicted dinucleotide-binding enzyme